MYRSLIFVVFLMLSVNASAQSLNLQLENDYKYQERSIMSNASSVPASNSDFKLDADANDKSVIPVVLSVSFLLMSLYGDNPDSPMYRAIGATATVMSISWYTD